MLKKLSLPVKVFMFFFPPFVAAVLIISYFNYTSTQEEMIAQVQNAAKAQANTIREALVNMMITNERVEDSFLKKISSTGDIKNINILFTLDSLHLNEEYLSDTSRVGRLHRREAIVWNTHADLDSSIFTVRNAEWYLACSKKIHPTRKIVDLSLDKPVFTHECEELQAHVPFIAEKKCAECHRVQTGTPLGMAVMSVPLEATAVHLKENAFRALLVFAGFIVLSLVINIFVFRKFINTPLQKLLRAIEEIGKGKVPTALHDNSFDDDEFGTLASAFEQMQKNLRQLQEETVRSERLSVLGQMASVIVHDFRTPMTSLSLGLEQLQSNHRLDAEKRKKVFEILQLSIHKIDRMMLELLEYSRGNTVLSYSDCSIDDLVRALENEFELHFQGTNIRFAVAALCRATIRIDKERMLRAIGNLVNNAGDALHDGGGISVLFEEEKDTIVITVSDTGKGIPKEIQETLFEPFVTSGKKKGTGLGLSSVKRVVELHKGTITFTSEPGAGTEFVITIPRTPSV